MMTKDDFRRHGGEGGPTRVSFREWWLIVEYLLADAGYPGLPYIGARSRWEQDLFPMEVLAEVRSRYDAAAGTPVTIDRVLDAVQASKRYPRGEIRLRRDEHGHEFRALLREYAGANPDVRDFGNRFDAVAWLKERGCAEAAILHVGFTP